MILPALDAWGAALPGKAGERREWLGSRCISPLPAAERGGDRPPGYGGGTETGFPILAGVFLCGHA